MVTNRFPTCILIVRRKRFISEVQRLIAWSSRCRPGLPGHFCLRHGSGSDRRGICSSGARAPVETELFWGSENIALASQHVQERKGWGGTEGACLQHLVHQPLQNEILVPVTILLRECTMCHSLFPYSLIF